MATSRARAAAPKNDQPTSPLFAALKAGMTAAPHNASDAAHDIGKALAESVKEILTDRRWLAAFDASFQEVGAVDFSQRTGWDGKIHRDFIHTAPNAAVDGRVIKIIIRRDDRVRLDLSSLVDAATVAETQTALASGKLLAHELLARIQSKNDPPSTALSLAAAAACLPRKGSSRDSERADYSAAFAAPATTALRQGLAAIVSSQPLGASALDASMGWHDGFELVLNLTLPGLDKLLFGRAVGGKGKRSAR